MGEEARRADVRLVVRRFAWGSPLFRFLLSDWRNVFYDFGGLAVPVADHPGRPHWLWFLAAYDCHGIVCGDGCSGFLVPRPQGRNER